MNFPRVVAVLLLAGTASAGAGESAERDYWIGKAALRVDVGWMKGGELSLSAEANEYNLDVYSHPGALPILPWDDDLMIRLSFTATR